MERPGLVIFDCDGVLVDTEPLSNRHLSEWLTGAGYPVTYEECRERFCGLSMRSVQQQVHAAGIDLGADFVDRWNAGLPGLFAQRVEAVPHVRDVIESLETARVPFCVASSARVSKMHITLGATGLLKHFEAAMFSSTMVARGKPFPDLFLHASQTMGFAPRDCIVVEDSIAGTKAGIAAGMRVYSYCGDPLSKREGLANAGGILFDDMRRLSGLIGLAQTSGFAEPSAR